MTTTPLRLLLLATKETAKRRPKKAVSFRVVLDNDPAERAVIDYRSKDLLAGLTTESLPADAPKFLKILISHKDQHQASWSVRAIGSTRRSSGTRGAGEKWQWRG